MGSYKSERVKPQLGRTNDHTFTKSLESSQPPARCIYVEWTDDVETLAKQMRLTEGPSTFRLLRHRSEILFDASRTLCQDGFSREGALGISVVQ